MITPDNLKRTFTPKQLQVIEHDARLNPRLTILEGAIRSGKTFVLIPLWLKHIYQFANKGFKFIMSGNTISTLKINILDDMSNLYGIDTHLNIHGEFELFGNTVKCVGSDKSDSYKKIKGMTAHGWLANEITESHPSFVDMAISRCSGHGARLFWDTNPEGPEHYIKTRYIDRSGEKAGITGNVRILAHHFVLDDNTNLSDAYMESLKSDYPKDSVWYKRYIDGLWVAAGNIIYTHWQKFGGELGNPLTNYDELVAGLDFGRGGQSPSAFVLMGRREQEYYCLLECYMPGVVNSEFIEHVENEIVSLNKQIKETLTIYADSADPDKIQEWKNAGWYCLPADKRPGSVLSGIEEVMKHPLYIHENCANVLKEIEAYEWRSDGNGKATLEPVKFRDHTMDAIRYAIHTHSQKTALNPVLDVAGVYTL